ncbi:MAG: hypothetical protein P8019_14305 [Gammaproteobacteria bacterium]
MIIHATTDPSSLRELPDPEHHPCVYGGHGNIVLKGDDSEA